LDLSLPRDDTDAPEALDAVRARPLNKEVNREPSLLSLIE
jgi:hypothetical protein